MASTLEEFRQRLGSKNTAPLWESMARLIPPEPKTRVIPALWRYDELRPLLMEAGSLITAQEAERRVLMLQNPGLGGESQITQSLYAGLQLVMPGEVTGTHRHAASALRFIIEGTGAYTAVNGERATMHPGDFIVTPSWTYHDHGNPSQEPIVWLDGLDVPIVNLFDTSFSEHYPQATQPESPNQGGVPAFQHPYARSREELARLHKDGRIDPRHGVKLQYKSGMAAIGAFLQLLPAGFSGKSYRATDATVCCVVEGSGRSRIGTTSLEWREHDIFVIPSWQFASHESDNEAVLFSFSDRPAQHALGLWREDA
jgi:gentisate 1,2-dioxygenase